MRAFRILGPVEASADGRLLPIGGHTQLKLFAFLRVEREPGGIH